MARNTTIQLTYSVPANSFLTIINTHLTQKPFICFDESEMSSFMDSEKCLYFIPIGTSNNHADSSSLCDKLLFKMMHGITNEHVCFRTLLSEKNIWTVYILPVV